jgi:hypothetical protein
MVKKLHNKNFQKKIWIILTIFILPAFVIWGSGSITRSQSKSVIIGKVDGKKITAQEFEESLFTVRNMAISQLGETFSELEKYLNIPEQAWERIILLSEAKKRKIKTTDREVIENIQKDPMFQGKNGFNNQIYSQVINYVFHTQPRQFEEEVRQNICLTKLYEEVTKEIQPNEEETLKEYRKENEKVIFNYIGAVFADFEKNIAPTEKELNGYFSKHSLDFKEPPAFRVEYLAINSEDKIKKMPARLRKNQDLNTLAKDLGLEVKETGMLKQNDPIPEIGWSSQISNLISGLKVDEIARPVMVNNTVYIIKLKETKESYVPELKDIKDKVKEALIKQSSEIIAKEKIENCLKEMRDLTKTAANTIDFQTLAKKYELKYGETEDFKYGSYIKGIGASDAFFDRAKDLKPKEFSSVIHGASGFYIIKLKSFTPIDKALFQKEKEGFVRKLREKMKLESFNKFLGQLKGKARLSNI